jgi:uncharacterized protein YndB with AHSA1/START domain
MLRRMPFSSSTSVVVNAPRTKIWDALIMPELVKQYFFGTNLVTDWKIGAPMVFRGQWEGKDYEDRGTVLSFEPLKGLSFNYWSAFSGIEDKPDLRQIVTYRLDDVDAKAAGVAGIKITVEQSNVDTQERADHSAKNWQGVMQGLKKLVEQAS